MARILAGALALILLAAAVATAAPDRTQTFAAAGELGWEGPSVTGASPLFDGTSCENPAPVGPYCDSTLIELKVPGTVNITIDGWNAESDLDLFFAKSDADGTYGEEAAPAPLGSGPGPEKLTAKNLAPGFYLIAVNYFQAVDTNFQGKVTFVPAGAAAPTQPTTSPADPAPPAGHTSPGQPSQPGQAPAGDPGALPASGSLSAQLKVTGKKVRKPAATVGCTVVCKVSLQMVVDKRTAKKLKLGKKATVIGKATATIDRKQAPPIAIKLTGKAKKKLKRVKKLKVSVKAVVTDSKGGQKKALSAKATLKK